MLQLRVDRVAMEVEGEQGIIILKDVEGDRMLPIWVGILEATSIALQMEGIKPARPLTHDLIKNLLDTLEAEVCMVIIHDLRDSTFYGQIVLKWQENTLEIDSRPSDAIAVALRTNAPIFVSDEVIDEAGIKAQQDPTVH